LSSALITPWTKSKRCARVRPRTLCFSWPCCNTTIPMPHACLARVFPPWPARDHHTGESAVSFNACFPCVGAAFTAPTPSGILLTTLCVFCPRLAWLDSWHFADHWCLIAVAAVSCALAPTAFARLIVVLSAMLCFGVKCNEQTAVDILWAVARHPRFARNHTIFLHFWCVLCESVRVCVRACVRTSFHTCECTHICARAGACVYVGMGVDVGVGLVE
jgi:hypothetical protein